MKRRARSSLAATAGIGGAVDRRQRVRRGQRADQNDAWRGDDLARLGAAERIRIGRVGKGAHRGPAVGEHAQSRRKCGADAEPIEHRRDVCTCGRERGIGEVERARSQQRGLQRLRAGDLRHRRSVEHGERGLDAAERHGRTRTQLAARKQRIDHRLGDDQDVARRAAAHRFAHRADGAEARVQRDAVVALEARAQCVDQSLDAPAQSTFNMATRCRLVETDREAGVTARAWRPKSRRPAPT